MLRNNRLGSHGDNRFSAKKARDVTLFLLKRAIVNLWRAVFILAFK